MLINKKSLLVGSITGVIAVSLVGLVSYLSINKLDDFSEPDTHYVLKDVISNDMPVVTTTDNKIIKPFDSEEVKVSIDYYDLDAKMEEQEKQLIKFERTYMPNTGILYSAKESFDVLSVLDGEVVDVSKSDTFGNIIQIKHDNDIITKYSSLNTVNVKVGDQVVKGEVIGLSGTNKVTSESTNMLLFEIIYEGNNVNPNKFYNVDIEELG